MRRSFLSFLFIAVLLLAGATPSVVATVSPARSSDNTLARAQNDGPDRNSPIGGTPVQDKPGSEQIDPLTFYESPTFGYVIPWFEDIWHLESSETGPNGDVVVFQRDDDVITFHGNEDGAGNPEACLSKLAGQLNQTSGVNVEPGEDADGNRIEGSGDFNAWALYVVTSDDDDERETIWHLECRRLKSDSAVLAITFKTTRDRYNGFAGATAYTFMDSVVLPRASYDLESVDGQLALIGFNSNQLSAWLFPRPPSLLLDRFDSAVGVATVVKVHDPSDGGTWYLFVQFESIGTSDLTVDPLAVTAMSRSGPSAEDELRPTDYRWETGDGVLSDQKQVLGPGERMIVRLSFEPFFESNPPELSTFWADYESDEIQASTIGAWDEPSSGGGRPRLS